MHSGDPWRDDWDDLTPSDSINAPDVTWTERRPTAVLYAPDGSTLAVTWDRPPVGFTR